MSFEEFTKRFTLDGGKEKSKGEKFMASKNNIMKSEKLLLPKSTEIITDKNAQIESIKDEKKEKKAQK